MKDLQGTAVDPTLLELFRAELDTHLPVLSDGLLALEKGCANEHTVAGMMRAAHSIKGAARIVGLEEAVRVAHVLEDCFTAAKEKGISLQSAAVDILLQGVDALQRVCSPQRDAAPGPTMLEGLIEQIASVRDGRTPIPAMGQVGRTTGPSHAAGPFPADERLIQLPANLDDEAAEQLRVQVCRLIRDRSSRIGLDFTQVDRVSAQAMSVLISLVRQTAGTDSAMAVRGVGGDLARLLRVTGLDRVWSTNG